MNSNDVIIFYSWQSDDTKTKTYIERHLNDLIAEMSEESELYLSPRIDKDTQGTTGAVNIAQTILAKIDASGIFLADVSLIDDSQKGRRLVNQNVMFELGYAIGKKSNSFVILVANADLGNINDLPFDIRGLRVIRFSPASDKQGASFKKTLKFAISSHIDALTHATLLDDRKTAKQLLRAAIEEQKPTRSLATSYFDQLYQRYLSNAPHRYKKDETIDAYKELIYEKYVTSAPITEEFYEVVNMAAEYGDDTTLQTAFRRLESITKYYDIIPEDGGQMSHISREYYGLIAYELVSILIGCIIRDDRWGAYDVIKDTKLTRPSGMNDPRTLERIYLYPQNLIDYYKSLRNANYIIPTTPLIKERFAGRKDILKTYLDGAFLLYLLLPHFYPWPVGLLLQGDFEEYVPDYIRRLKSKAFVKQLMSICGSASLAEFKDMLAQKAGKEHGGFIGYHYSTLDHVFSYAGIKSKDDISTN